MPHGSSSHLLAIATALTRSVRQVIACDDPTADNYDGGLPTSCVPRPVIVCTDPAATNTYAGDAPAATIVAAPWLCRYPVRGCSHPDAANYREDLVASANFIHEPRMCQYGGCNDTDARNYDSRANSVGAFGDVT